MKKLKNHISLQLKKESEIHRGVSGYTHNIQTPSIFLWKKRKKEKKRQRKDVEKDESKRIKTKFNDRIMMRK